MPAQYRDSAGVLQRRVGELLALGCKNLALLGIELELVKALSDCEAVKARELVDRVQWVVRERQRLLHALDEPIPPSDSPARVISENVCG